MTESVEGESEEESEEEESKGRWTEVMITWGILYVLWRMEMAASSDEALAIVMPVRSLQNGLAGI